MQTQYLLCVWTVTKLVSQMYNFIVDLAMPDVIKLGLSTDLFKIKLFKNRYVLSAFLRNEYLQHFLSKILNTSNCGALSLAQTKDRD